MLNAQTVHRRSAVSAPRDLKPRLLALDRVFVRCGSERACVPRLSRPDRFRSGSAAEIAVLRFCSNFRRVCVRRSPLYVQTII